jgi:hypothetical protein
MVLGLANGKQIIWYLIVLENTSYTSTKSVIFGSSKYLEVPRSTRPRPPGRPSDWSPNNSDYLVCCSLVFFLFFVLRGFLLSSAPT